MNDVCLGVTSGKHAFLDDGGYVSCVHCGLPATSHDATLTEALDEAIKDRDYFDALLREEEEKVRQLRETVSRQAAEATEYIRRIRALEMPSQADPEPPISDAVARRISAVGLVIALLLAMLTLASVSGWLK